MRIEQFLLDAAARHPDHIALRTDAAALTYGQFAALADRVAAALQHAGIGRDDRVVIFAENRVEVAVAIFATLRLGGIFSVVNPTTKVDKLAYILNDCEAAALLTQDTLFEVASGAVVQAPCLRVGIVFDSERTLPTPASLVWGDLLGHPESTPRPSDGLDIDLAMLVYTSGSTGEPKGVMMTHRNVEFASGSIISYLEMTEREVILSVLPLAFDYGLYQLLMSVRLGATLILEQSFAFPQRVLQRIPAHQVTCFPLVPTMAALILHQRSLDPALFASVERVTNTAAALPPAHITRLRELFGAGRVFSMYGLTECKRCTWLPPTELDRRPDSVGIPIPGTEAWIVDDANRRLGPDEVGELVIRGAHVMPGYWRNEVATAKALHPGPWPWEKVLYTGDLFRRDAEGFLYFVGRKDDIIKSRGEKVSPKEVENVLYAMPGIREAAIVGVPDPILGRALRAIVACEPETILTAREVIAHCSARLEDFMVPRQVEFRDTLPKGDTGKILRRILQEEVNRGHTQ